MFQNARSFNQPLNNWNVSKVETMFAMFDAPSARFRLLLLKPAQHELAVRKIVKCSRGTLHIAVPAFHGRAAHAGDEPHRQREERGGDLCMASRRGSRHVSGRGRRVAAKPLELACMSCRLALPTQSTGRAAIYVHRHRFTALTYSRVHLLHR